MVAGAGFLLGTEAGMRTAYRVVHYLVPELLTVGRLEGSVLGGVVIEDIAMDLPPARVGIRRLALDWRPERLLRGELRVVALELAGTDITLRETEEDSAPLEELPTVALPRRLIVERLQITGLAVTAPGVAETVTNGGFVDNEANWPATQWRGCVARIAPGTTEEACGTIAHNTNNRVFVNWTAPPGGRPYEILGLLEEGGRDGREGLRGQAPQV